MGVFHLSDFLDGRKSASPLIHGNFLREISDITTDYPFPGVASLAEPANDPDP